jgi:hypothetical protein
VPGLRPVSELGLADPTDIAPHEDVAAANTASHPAALSGRDEDRAQPLEAAPTASSRPVRKLGPADTIATTPSEHVPDAPAPERRRAEPDDDQDERGLSVTAPDAPTRTRQTRDRRRRTPSVTLGAEPQSTRSLFPKSRQNAVELADEPTIFVQVMVPGDVSHMLAAEHRKLRHHKTILGALLWRHVEPNDTERLRQLGALLDAYLETDVSEAPAEIKVGAHLPFSLKYKLEGAALALRRTRRAASAKALLSALIWRYVDTTSVADLVQLLVAYREESRPKPLPLGSTSPDQNEDARESPEDPVGVRRAPAGTA